MCCHKADQVIRCVSFWAPPLGQVYVLNRDTASRLAISSPLEAHKSNAIVFHTCGVDVGFDNPIFAVSYFFRFSLPETYLGCCCSVFETTNLNRAWFPWLRVQLCNAGLYVTACFIQAVLFCCTRDLAACWRAGDRARLFGSRSGLDRGRGSQHGETARILPTRPWAQPRHQVMERPHQPVSNALCLSCAGFFKRSMLLTKKVEAMRGRVL